MSEVVEIDEIDLPEGWQMAELADLAINPKDDIVDGPFGSNLKASEYTETGVPIVRLQNIKRNYFLDKNIKCVTPEKAEQLSRHSFKPGDLLITKLGAPLGVACIAPKNIGDGIIVADLVRARLPEDVVDTKYITYLINSPGVIQQFKENTKGTTRPRVNLKFLRSLQLPIAPPEQQKRIVAKIEELFSHIDAGIEALKKAKQLLKQYRQSVLKAAVTGELTKEWREANKDKLEPASQLLERILKERRQKWEEQQLEQFKAKGKMPKNDKWKGKYKEPESRVSIDVELPEGWALCVLDQMITELKNGISKKPAEESGLAIFRISAVRPMEVNKDDVRFLPNDFDASGYEIEDDDLLFTRYNGNPELVGVCGKVRGLQRKTVYPDKLMRARLVNQELVYSDYLERSLNCGISKEFIRTWTKTTAGQSGIAGGDVKKCPVVLPGYEEQIQIAAIVDEKFTAIEHLDAELDQQLVKAEKNKQSVLASAFSGKIHQ